MSVSGTSTAEPATHPGAQPEANPVPAPSSPEGVAASRPTEGAQGDGLTTRLEAARSSLPRISALRAQKPEDLHHAPEGVVAAGASIGELREYLENHPGEFREASRFFAECFKDSDVLPAIRALCLHTLKEKPDQWPNGMKARVESAPAVVRDLESLL